MHTEILLDIHIRISSLDDAEHHVRGLLEDLERASADDVWSAVISLHAIDVPTFFSEFCLVILEIISFDLWDTQISRNLFLWDKHQRDL